MSEEQAKILKMLAEGKIKAEQAERLLAAIGEGGGSAPARPPAEESMAKLGKLVERIVSNRGLSFAGISEDTAGEPVQAPEQGFAVSPDTVVEVKAKGCNVRVVRSDQEGMLTVIPGDGQNVSVRQSDGRVSVRAWPGAGNLAVRLPAVKSLALDTAGGNAELDGLRTNVEASVKGGNLTAKDCAGRLGLKVMGGNADVEGQISGINLKCMGGSANVRGISIVEGEHNVKVMGGGASLTVSPGASLTVRAKAFGGGVTADGPSAAGSHGEFKFGDGAAALDVKAFGGGVDIRRAS
jgi:hypothetical protein